MLIYNGDVDTVCNFLGDEWFVLDFARMNSFLQDDRSEWYYQQGFNFLAQIGGYHQHFYGIYVNIDYVTVKGAGHFVPLDRGGPSLQLLTNFMKEQSYNTTMTYDITPKSLYPQYSIPKPKQKTRKERARIWNLPGLTYKINFRQYSGYLKGVTGNYLHYWFVCTSNFTSC
ncbi:unnamed protein product [Thelazia callipaeda]|uniref:Serine carboxypeptidase n=1 Tax=Thelazia callipaeda TaxID=103827 RepID=A0A0N5CTT5_THECL|nr:unnamed protein product [Thelazia callipaeda]